MLSSLTRKATTLAQRFDSRALAPVPASRPAVMRIVNGVYTAIYMGKRVKLFRKVHRTDPELFKPVGPIKVLSAPLPPAVADALYYASMATNVASAAGVAHRITGPLHAALITWTMSYRNSWSMILHDQGNLLLHTAVLGATPSADALSVDAWLRKPGNPALTRAQTDNWVYALPIRGMQLTTAVHYFLAGVAKLCGPMGVKWGDGEVLRRQIMEDGLRKELLGSKATNLGVALTRRPVFFTAMATGSLALELFAPVFLVDKRAAQAWAVGAWGMHWGIKLVMGITFRHNLYGVLYTPYFDMEKVLPQEWR